MRSMVEGYLNKFSYPSVAFGGSPPHEANASQGGMTSYGWITSSTRVTA